MIPLLAVFLDTWNLDEQCIRGANSKLALLRKGR